MPDEDAGEETGAGRGVDLDLDGVPDLAQEEEEGPGGGMTTQGHGPTTEPETGTGTETEDGIQSADEQGQNEIPALLCNKRVRR